MAEVFSTGVSHICDNSTLSVNRQQCQQESHELQTSIKVCMFVFSYNYN